MTLLALQDLFRHHRERATGLWKLGVEPNRTIFLEAGDVVFAQSTHPMDRLTYLLVERGKLTQAQLDYALANLKPGLSIGKNLIEMGFITQRDLLDVARAQVERVVQGALGTPDQSPVFEPKDLDASVVRLPLDTPQLLLNGMLNLQDRERLLELLGPLNQVVVLQGKRLMEMTLPADLAKLPPLLDGTHTLLELSREALAEPLRLGTFALFLREIGWARLHEMPPLDRQALDMALTSELEPLSPPLPEPAPETVPSLFSTIEAAARPTTNLEHLSHALDAIPEAPGLSLQDELFPPEDERTPETPLMIEPPVAREPPLPAIDASGFAAETGRALLPTPNMELPEPPMVEDRTPEPSVTLRPSTLPPEPELITVPEAPPTEVSPEEPPHPRSKVMPIVLLALLLGALGAGAWWWFKMRPGASVVPPPAPGPTVPATPAPVAPAPVTPSTPEPSTPEPPVTPPQPAARPGTSLQERSDSLRKGDLDLAIRQGEAFLQEGPASHWTVRLEIACMGETMKRAVDYFPEGKADLFVLPIALKDGRTCYQVFYGKFPSRKAAERQTAGLPKAFHEGGNRPKVFRISEIPSRQ